ncbi:hypothetical protein VV869_13465 [Photobacterium sp. MCCC 1A19761]|uniref:hypothetical protein n=1 Tax=Photobacterium sp. MCCC 1A19761 TaxID=3115000 RepID=UPI00307D1230
MVAQARESIKGTYQQTLNVLEALDQGVKQQQKTSEPQLCFPFDLLDNLTRSATSQWRAAVGLGSPKEYALQDELSKQEQLLSRMQKQFNLEKSALAEALSEKEAQHEQVKAEADKATKAKNTAQRAQRKLKAELETSLAEHAALKEELNTIQERYDLQVSQSEQQLAGLKAEKEKLLAETESLKQQLEALEHQLAQSSQYAP